MDVEVTNTGDTIRVVCPYSTHFISRAKKIGGKWRSPAWIFDPRDEQRVEAILASTYGWRRPAKDEPLATIQLCYETDCQTSDMRTFFAGCQVVSIRGRDSGATMGRSAVVIEGNVTSAGSRKNPLIKVRAGTIIELRDIPYSVAKAAVAEDADELGGTATLLDEGIDRDALLAERAQLILRLSIIDAQLGSEE